MDIEGPRKSESGDVADSGSAATTSTLSELFFPLPLLITERRCKELAVASCRCMSSVSSVNKHTFLLYLSSACINTVFVIFICVFDFIR